MTLDAKDLRLEDLDDLSFDAFSFEKLFSGDVDDPYPKIHKWMEQGSIIKGKYRDEFSKVPDPFYVDEEQYLVLGYDAVTKVLMRPEIFRNYEAQIKTLGQFFGEKVLTVLDAPDHTKFRKIFQKAFLPNVVGKWGDTIVQPVLDGLMEKFLDRGEADLIEDFTHHFPFQIIYRQINIGMDQAPVFHKIAVAQLLSAVGRPEGLEATEKLGKFFSALVEERRRNPGPDLVSHLANIELDGELLPTDVLIDFLRQLMNAGGDTTYRATSCLLTGLLTNPDQYAAIEKDRSLIPQAIDEALRWEPPASVVYRTAVEDTEIDGVKIPKGALMNVVLASANRDPAKFENPDKFDIFRSRKVRHYGFAVGPHVCVGQHLARVEMTRAINAVLDKMKNLRLDPDKPGPNITGHILRSPEHLYVKFDRA